MPQDTKTQKTTEIIQWRANIAYNESKAKHEDLTVI